MSKPIAMALIALALAAGFLGGMAVPRSSSEIKMTPYERGRLIAECNGLSGVRPSENFIPTGKPSPREACLEAISKLP